MNDQIDLADLTTKPRLGVTRTSPMGPRQKRPSSPLWVTHQPRGMNDPRPWVVGRDKPEHDDLRLPHDRVIELTDVPQMTMTYDNIDAVLDFMGAEYAHGTRDGFGALLAHPEWGEVSLGQGTTVWKLDSGRCYIQHRSSPTIMFPWPPVEVPL